MSEKLMSHGTMFDLLSPDPWSVKLEEIARALSRIRRFNGATSRPWTVAQHCIAGYQLILTGKFAGQPEPEMLHQMALAFLLHDAAEAYIGDIPTPFKQHLGQFVVDAEESIMNAITAAIWPEFFNLDDPVQQAINAVVKAIDRDMLAIERNLWMPDHPGWVMQWPEHADIKFNSFLQILASFSDDYVMDIYSQLLTPGSRLWGKAL